jgi:hypothetical protein
VRPDRGAYETLTRADRSGTLVLGVR